MSDTKITIRCNSDANGKVLNATWTLTHDAASVDYCTSHTGAGVFIDSPSRPQLAGACQFSIRGCSVRAAQARIRRYHRS